jgi:ectoine hydroxylase-related dioxygenase (phytanoyl-CoA dioxygenase family)
MEMKFADPDMLNARGDGGAQARVFAEIARLGLEKNVLDLDMRGYTVLTPEQVAPRGFVERLRERVLDHAEAETGVRPDVTSGGAYADKTSVLGQSEILTDVLFSDPLFEQALMNAPVLALLSYLLGEHCVMNAFNAVIKGPGHEHVAVHIDSGEPNPLPPYAQVANATWLLTDYGEGDGVTCFEPGSHRRCRNPSFDETTDLSAVVPMNAPAGSVAIWSGHTWHAALPRTNPGLRMSLLSIFSRHYLRAAPEEYAPARRVTPEMLERNAERFATLMGVRELSRHTKMLVHNSPFV